MNDIKWIKLATDLFNNRKIKQIKKMPEGKSIVLIWIQILCLAGECNNNGLIYFSKDIPYTDEMLSTEFDEDLKIIRLALQIFEKFGMMEVVDNIMLVGNWEKYQNVESLEKIRQQNRIRQANHREKQKELIECNVTSNVMSHQNNAIELELEEELEQDKDIKREKKQKYGQFTNVLLTLTEFENLKKDYLNHLEGIEYMSNYLAMTGKKYKSHNLAIRKWVFNAIEEDKLRKSKTNGQPKRTIEANPEILKANAEATQRKKEREEKEQNDQDDMFAKMTPEEIKEHLKKLGIGVN